MCRTWEKVGWESESGFLGKNIAFKLLLPWQMKCIVCKIEKAWCFPQRLNLAV